MFVIKDTEKEKLRKEKIKKSVDSRFSLIGKKFGKLKVIAEYSEKKRRYCVCKCDCGNKSIVLAQSLKNGHTQSCGCLLEEFRNKNNRIFKNPLYRMLKGMISRCYNEKDKRYKNYGGRNITICEDWLDDPYNFINWALKNGYKDKLSIERKNVNDNYCPENCCFIPLSEQARNKTNNRKIKYNGEIKSLVEWCELFNLSYKAVHYRLTKGWDLEKAFKTKTPTGFKRSR